MKALWTLFLFVASTAAAMADTSRYTISDDFFGLSDTHIFFLRVAGQYAGADVGVTDIFLIAKNRSDGRDEQIWPVYREFAQADGNLRIEGLEGAVDPFERMLEQGGAHMPQKPTEIDRQALTDGGLDVAGGQIAREPVYADIVHSLQLMSDALQPYGTVAPFDPMAALAGMQEAFEQFDVLCELTGFAQVAPDEALAYIECQPTSQPGSIGFYAMIRPR
ncbi:hypothetical protein [Pseudaestuariivita rosea]|uniref:hypothetical protein n=1 Tax=Pseudaestuariivita rosea TaxID=2763263 RepID=UPI001ABAD0A7|nr:hypothetical protein [Pseudaestuariivita rosea]